VKEVSGTVEVFLPGRDPAALVRVDRFLSSADKPISAPGLKAAQAGHGRPPEDPRGGENEGGGAPQLR
jgi:hypothetical protein